MRVLVTGAAGLLGGHLVPLLHAQGHGVVAVDRAEGDLADAATARRVVAAAAPDAVVHLAGGPGGDRAAVHRANVLTTENVVAAAGAAGRPQVVVLGSAAEYGDGGAELLAEEAPLRPVTEYGRAKVAATTAAAALATELEVPLTVARPFNVVVARPPRQTPLGNLSAQLLEQEGPRRLVQCGRLDVIRDFVPAGFVAEALVGLVQGRHLGIYNVCSGLARTPAEVLGEMAATLGIEAVVELVPDLAALPAADRVVGDPARLAGLGLRCAPTARDLARLCLGLGPD